MKQTHELDNFDFGFTLVNSNELEEVQIREKAAESWESKTYRIYNAIMPLLNNLGTDDGKDYIYWPNRSEKIEQFKSKLRSILEE